ncbi:MAG: PAS domain S-box protein [Spirochaetales bacterium]|nr:PAS domain S-box protein [Spirochaetales bacterium]
MENKKPYKKNKQDSTLAAFEQWYRNLARTSPDIIFVIDNRNIVRFVNDTAAQLFSSSSDTFIDKPIERLFTGKILERQKANIRLVLETGKPIHRVGISEFGTQKIWLETTLTPILNETGGVSAVIGISRDITVQKETEIALKEKQELFQVILESIADGVIVTDIHGSILLMNGVAERYTGWSSVEAQNKAIHDVVSLQSLKDNTPYINIVPLILREKKCVDFYNELIITSRGGEKHYVSQTGTPLLNSEGNITGVVVVFKDITELLVAEEDMIRSERLDSIGILAGGIGHDFNNILTGILGNISLMRKFLGNPSELSEIIEQSEKAAVRAKDLTRQLLTFSKGGDPVKTASSIKDILQETIAFLLSGTSITAEYAFSENLPSVEIDQAQIGQVIQNIVINAKQAMNNTGKLTVTAEECVSDGTLTSLALNRHYICISIRDSGKGIPKTIQKKVLDPFFTTKKKGTGLGLTICYSIIQKHHGILKIHSEKNEGTTISFYLPVTNAAVSGKYQSTNSAAAGNKRILVIDDEVIIRRTAESCLKSIGYRTMSTEDGPGGIEMYTRAMETADPYHLVIIDLTIRGGMSGLEVIQRLLQLDPGVRAIVSSGYSDDTVLANHTKHGFCGVLSKPYTMEELSEVVRKALP